MSITEADLADAILAALEATPKTGREPGTITTSELAKEYELSLHTAAKILTGMFAVGTVEKAFVRRVDGWGGNIAPKGYRLIRQDKD